MHFWTLADELLRKEELKRITTGLLNQIYVEKADKLAIRLKEETHVKTGEELKVVTSTIIRQALSKPYYSEMYADIACYLIHGMPEFPSEGGGKPVKFKSTLLNLCQHEFESMRLILQPGEEQVARYDTEALCNKIKQQKNRLTAFLIFVGHLFLRDNRTMLPKIVTSVITDLLTIGKDGDDGAPEAYVVFGVCDLLMLIGCALESQQTGREALAQICRRLTHLDLKSQSESNGICNSPIRIALQGLLYVRTNGWKAPMFTATLMSCTTAGDDHCEFDLKLSTVSGEQLEINVPAGSTVQAVVSEIRARKLLPHSIQVKIISAEGAVLESDAQIECRPNPELPGEHE